MTHCRVAVKCPPTGGVASVKKGVFDEQADATASGAVEGPEGDPCHIERKQISHGNLPEGWGARFLNYPVMREAEKSLLFGICDQMNSLRTFLCVLVWLFNIKYKVACIYFEKIGKASNCCW
ncbi:hypothetical protein ACI2VH_10200 [Ralstonia nicotianae]